MVREVNYDDLQGLLKLYTQLHDNPFPDVNETLLTTWKKIVNDENYHIIVAEKNCFVLCPCYHSQSYAFSTVLCCYRKCDYRYSV